MFARMKRISFLVAAAIIALPALTHAQDAATEERLNKLTAQMQDLIEMQAAQSKRIDAMAKDLQNLQVTQANKPVVEYASQEDLKQLAAKLQEVDRKRQEDNDRILEELRKLGSTIKAASNRRPTPSNSDTGSAASNRPEKGFEYKIHPGDTLDAISRAYQDQEHIKVTVKQILDANPGLKAERLIPGQTIFIPAPAQ